MVTELTYQHYKGKIYTFVANGTNAETGEPCVIYRNDAGQLWVRSLFNFTEKILVDGKETSRFTPIK